METPGGEIVKSILITAFAGLALGVLFLVMTSPDRGGDQKFGICKRDSSGAEECLMTFTKEQWHFLGNICDKR